MLPFLLLVQTAPRDLTPPNAMARRMLYKPGEKLAPSGLGSLNRHLLPAGDVEVRYWGGFSRGTWATILRRRSGQWSAARLVTVRPFHLRPLPVPAIGWPAFWAKAEKLGIFTLPDDANIKERKGYAHIDDGYSTLVEYQKDGLYRAYAYNNPTNQYTWPPAKPMAALDAFVTSQFPR